MEKLYLFYDDELWRPIFHRCICHNLANHKLSSQVRRDHAELQ